jgi:hypothetical protein
VPGPAVGDPRPWIPFAVRVPRHPPSMPATNMHAVWWATRGERLVPPDPGSWANVAAEQAPETIPGEARSYGDRQADGRLRR